MSPYVVMPGLLQRLLPPFSLVNLKVEPTGVLSIAGLLADRSGFAGKRICCVLSGGNGGASVWARILENRS